MHPFGEMTVFVVGEGFFVVLAVAAVQTDSGNYIAVFVFVLHTSLNITGFTICENFRRLIVLIVCCLCPAGKIAGCRITGLFGAVPVCVIVIGNIIACVGGLLGTYIGIFR